MDVVEQIIRSGLTLAAIVLILLLIAALFMIVFKIATGIDDQIQED